MADRRFQRTGIFTSRGATMVVSDYDIGDYISTHTPLAGRDVIIGTDSETNSISTHTPLAGRDPGMFERAQIHEDFYSHAPRGARLNIAEYYWKTHNFYSHAPRGARLGFLQQRKRKQNFYSHAPRGGATSDSTT